MARNSSRERTWSLWHPGGGQGWLLLSLQFPPQASPPRERPLPPRLASCILAVVDRSSGCLLPLSYRRFGRNLLGCVRNTVARNSISFRNAFSTDTFCVIRELLSSEALGLSCSHLHPGFNASPGQFPHRPNSFYSTCLGNSANATGSTSLSGYRSAGHPRLNVYLMINILNMWYPLIIPRVYLLNIPRKQN